MEHLTVERKKFEKIVKAVRKHNMQEITFEFIVGSCFPDIMNNIKEEMRRQYTLGYVEGQKNRDEI